jgi:hypothetical protein
VDELAPEFSLRRSVVRGKKMRRKKEFKGQKLE